MLIVTSHVDSIEALLIYIDHSYCSIANNQFEHRLFKISKIAGQHVRLNVKSVDPPNETAESCRNVEMIVCTKDDIESGEIELLCDMHAYAW